MNPVEKVFRTSNIIKKIFSFIDKFEDYKNIQECCPLFKHEIERTCCLLSIYENKICYIILKELTEENTISIVIDNKNDYRVTNIRKEPMKLKEKLINRTEVVIIYNYKTISSWYKKEVILTTNYLIKNILKNIETIMFYFSDNNASEFWTYLLPMFNTIKLERIGQFFSRYFIEKCEICQPRLFDFSYYKSLKFIDTSLLVHTEYYEEDCRMIKWLIKSLRNTTPVTIIVRILGNNGNNNGMNEGTYKDLLSSSYAKEVVRNINNSNHYIKLELNTSSWDIETWFGKGKKKNIIYPPKKFKEICFKKIKILTINLNNTYYFPNFAKYYSFNNKCILEEVTIIICENFEEELTLNMITNLFKILKNVSTFKDLSIINKNVYGQSFVEYLIQHIPINVKKLSINGIISYSNIILQSITTRCLLLESLIMGKPRNEEILPESFLLSLTIIKYFSFWCFEEDSFFIPDSCCGVKIECHCFWSDDMECSCVRRVIKCHYKNVLHIIDDSDSDTGLYIHFNKFEDCIVLKNL